MQAMPRSGRAALGLALLAVLPGVGACSAATGLGVGPVLVRSAGRSGYGDELRLNAGVGSSNGHSISTADASARVRITERDQSLDVGLGPAYTHWLGRSLVMLHGEPGLGVARYDSVLFVKPTLTAGLGTGWVLGERTRPSAPWSLVAAMEGADQWSTVRRERRVLTLELTGGVEALGARPVLLYASLLIGIARFDESYTVERLPPWWLPFMKPHPR